MLRITIDINTDNDAFQEDARVQVQQIIQDQVVDSVPEKICEGYIYNADRKIKDYN